MKTKWIIKIPIALANKIKKPAGGFEDVLKPVEHYARLPLPESMTNWEVLLPILRGGAYFVSFKSLSKKGLSEEDVAELDIHDGLAHEAAIKSEGFLGYYRGRLLTDDEKNKPNCMSFCGWKTLENAHTGAQLKQHRNAAQQVQRWYELYELAHFQVRTELVTAKNGHTYECIIFEQIKRPPTEKNVN